VGVPVPKFFSNIYNRPCTVGLLLQGVPPFRAIPHAFPSVGIQNKVLLAMPYIATSCCILKASLCRDRSCFLLNPVCPATGLVGKGCRLCNPVFACCHAIHKRCSAPFKSGLPISFVSSQKKSAKEKDVAQSPRGFFRFDFRTAFSGLRKLSLFGICLRQMFRCSCCHYFFHEHAVRGFHLDINCISALS